MESEALVAEPDIGSAGFLRLFTYQEAEHGESVVEADAYHGSALLDAVLDDEAQVVSPVS